MNTPTRRRLPAGERQQQVLRAAVAAFAEGGYDGTSTDQVARLAGVSQPYVVRMFGGKQALFLAAHGYVMERVENAFREAVAHRPPDLPPLAALREAYLGLIHDRDLLRMMEHGFVAGADPTLGPLVRDCLTRIYTLVKELSGATPEQARDFLATGLLINTLVAVQLPELAPTDPAAAELLRCALGPRYAAGQFTEDAAAGPTDTAAGRMGYDGPDGRIA